MNYANGPLFVMASVLRQDISGNTTGGSVTNMGYALDGTSGDNRTLEELQKLVGLPVLGIVPYDQTLQNFDAQGKTLLELSDETPAVAAVKKIVDKLMA